MTLNLFEVRTLKARLHFHFLISTIKKPIYTLLRLVSKIQVSLTRSYQYF